MTNPNTPYNPNTPLVDESYADWQIDFLNNFQKMNLAFSANHQPLASNLGNHTVVQLNEQSADPTLGVSEVGLYSKFVSSTTPPSQQGCDQLFFGTGASITGSENSNWQVTQFQVNTSAKFFTFLPGRVVMCWGEIVLQEDKTSTLPLNFDPLIDMMTSILFVGFTPVSTTKAGFQPTITIEFDPTSTFVTKIIAKSSNKTTPITNITWAWVIFGTT